MTESNIVSKPDTKDDLKSLPLPELGENGGRQRMASARSRRKLQSQYGPNALEEMLNNALLKFLGYFWEPILWMIEIVVIQSAVDVSELVSHIRACFKQPEFEPVPVPGQIAILLALTDRLFGSVPQRKMSDAEPALRKAANELPVELVQRLVSTEVLSDGDREAILKIASDTRALFQKVA